MNLGCHFLLTRRTEWWALIPKDLRIPGYTKKDCEALAWVRNEIRDNFNLIDDRIALIRKTLFLVSTTILRHFLPCAPFIPVFSLVVAKQASNIFRKKQKMNSDFTNLDSIHSYSCLGLIYECEQQLPKCFDLSPRKSKFQSSRQAYTCRSYSPPHHCKSTIVVSCRQFRAFDNLSII